MSSNKPNRIAIFGTGVALGLTLMTGAASAVPGPPNDPAGNNGSIKVDNLGYDDAPGNEPHVGCSFQIDFFGFDLGDSADIRFFAQPPSGDKQLLHEDLQVPVSDDAAGGSNDVDAAVTYDASLWDLSALTPAAQGIHVKVEADIVGAPGGAKQKVFWIDCTPADDPPAGIDDPPAGIDDPPAGIDDPPAGIDDAGEVVVESLIVVANPVVTDVTASEAAPVLPAVASETAAAQVEVIGAELEQSAPALAAEPAQVQVLGVSYNQGPPLARTGVNTALLTMVGSLLLAVGTVLTRLGRATAPAGNKR